MKELIIFLIGVVTIPTIAVISEYFWPSAIYTEDIDHCHEYQKVFPR